MINRLRTRIATLALLFSASFTAQAQTPRTPDGHPDLQGTWTINTLTPLERPAEFAGKPTLSDEEALAYEKRDHNPFSERDLPGESLARVQEGNAIGAGDSEMWETGSALARVDGLKRTSMIVDPPDGKIPALTPEAKQRAAARRANRDQADSVKDLSPKERCLAYSTVPMVQQAYNNNYQIVQTPGYVMILGEMIHDARIIRMNATHTSQSVHQWLGDSTGSWEGDTLVIDTTNFKSQGAFRGGTENLHVVERLSRPDADTLLYRATIDDPATFSKPWTIEYPLTATTDRIFEYACHEGNSWVESRLTAARKAEAAAGAR
ncbi:MAG TPA: hypothetical protein VKR61_01675 [Bryobacteraceae bacterium]|nr:hypothetical protein [Bryobacteraceae bacterium]